VDEDVDVKVGALKIRRHRVLGVMLRLAPLSWLTNHQLGRQYRISSRKLLALPEHSLLHHLQALKTLLPNELYRDQDLRI
jgi:hypothetical protein